MALVIEDLVKSKSKLRAALVGPSGSGKSYSALLLAKYLGEYMGLSRVCAVDTENKSLGKYANITRVRAINLSGNYSPEHYIEAIDLAEGDGAEILLIDSLSHAYMGVGGLLEQADAAAKRGGNSFTSWRGVSSKHDRLMERMLQSKCHIIGTYRSKVQYEVEKNEKGKSTPKKVGMEAITKGGNDASYEFDVVFTLAHDNSVTIDKTRCEALNGKTFDRIDKSVAKVLADWLDDGVPEAEPIDRENTMPAVGIDPPYAPVIANLHPNNRIQFDELLGWEQRIAQATMADLEAMLPLLKVLKPETQAALVPLYRERKAALSA